MSKLTFWKETTHDKFGITLSNGATFYGYPDELLELLGILQEQKSTLEKESKKLARLKKRLEKK